MRERIEHEICERCRDQFEWNANYGWQMGETFTLEQQQGVYDKSGSVHIWCDDCIINHAVSVGEVYYTEEFH